MISGTFSTFTASFVTKPARERSLSVRAVSIVPEQSDSKHDTPKATMLQ